MKTSRATLLLIGGVTLLSFGCATKGYVREQLSPTQARLAETGQRVDGHEAKLRDTTAQIDASRQRADGFDSRLSETGAAVGRAAAQADEASNLARDAKKSSESTAEAVRDVDSRLTARIANRNRFTALDTRSIFFEFGRSDIKDDGMTALVEVVKALKEDPNAILEISGHTDAVGAERANLQLSRDRVDSVVRYLIQQGVELRRVHTVGLGKAVPVADNNTREGRAKNRRVDVRLLSPQS